jgi:branched-chain amino acid transport system permease protein
MIVFGLILMVVMIFMPQGLTRGIMDMIRTAGRARA